MKNSQIEFEKGMRYADLQRSLSFHKYLGWGMLVMAPIWFFFSVWEFNTRVNGWAAMTLFGSISLLLAYSEKRELKDIK